MDRSGAQTARLNFSNKGPNELIYSTQQKPKIVKIAMKHKRPGTSLKAPTLLKQKETIITSEKAFNSTLNSTKGTKVLASAAKPTRKKQ